MSDQITPEELLGHRAWLSALAHSLVHAGADADDLVQDTWVAALRHPPRRGPGLRAWLRTVLVNRFRERHRRERRQLARERSVARSERIPATLEVVERAEIQTRLSCLVLELPEPDRNVLLLHFFDGVPAREIARQLDLPYETVRTRMRRALDRLRGLLDAEFRRDGRDWRLVLLPLIDAPARSRPIAKATWFAAGVTLMTSKLFLGGAALVSAVLVGLALFAGSDEPAALPVDTQQADRVAIADTLRSDPRRDRGDDADRAERTETASGSTPSPDEVAATESNVRLLVRGKFTGVDATLPGDVRLRLFGIQDPIGKGDVELEGSGSLSAGFEIDATRLLEATPPAEVVIAVDHPLCLPTSTRVPLKQAGQSSSAPRVLDVKIALERAQIATGRVTDHDGRPVVEAYVCGFPMRAGRRLRGRAPSVMTDATGRFRMRLSDAPEQLLIACTENGQPIARRVQIVSETDTEVGDLSLGPPLEVRGTVRRSDGTTCAGATVAAVLVDARGWFRVGPHELVWDGTRVLRSAVETTCHEDGTFELFGMSAAEYRVSLRLDEASPDLGDALAQTVVPPTSELEFVVGGALLVVEGMIEGQLAADHRLTIGSERFAGVIRLDETGRGTMLCVPGARYRVSTSRPGYERFAQDLVMPAAGETIRVRFDLRPQAHLARVPLDFGEEPPADLKDVLLWLTPLDAARAGTGVSARAWRHEDGVFRTTEIPPGRYRVRVRPGAQMSFSAGFFTDVHTELTIPFDGSEPPTLQVPLTPAGRLRVTLRRPDGSLTEANGTIHDASGRTVDFTCAVRAVKTMTTAKQRFLPGANDVAPALRPGRYTIELESESIRPHTLRVEVRAGEVTDVEGELTPK